MAYVVENSICGVATETELGMCHDGRLGRDCIAGIGRGVNSGTNCLRSWVFLAECTLCVVVKFPLTVAHSQNAFQAIQLEATEQKGGTPTRIQAHGKKPIGLRPQNPLRNWSVFKKWGDTTRIGKDGIAKRGAVTDRRRQNGTSSLTADFFKA